jgi:hypothetical protein
MSKSPPKRRPKSSSAARARAKAARLKRARTTKKARAATRARATTRKTAPKRAAARKPSKSRVRTAVAKKVVAKKAVAKKAVAKKVAAKNATPAKAPARRKAAARKPGLPPKAAAVVAPAVTPPFIEAEPVAGVPSSLSYHPAATAARSGSAELREARRAHTETDPRMTGGDVDADWEAAYSTGDEAPGGDNPTPDQDAVDDIGRALGVHYDDREELQGAEKIKARDKHRWELDPASSDDYLERGKREKGKP